MKQYPYWKPVLILAVLVICALLIYPTSQKLKPGLDLAGGTILLYQVDVPSGSNGKDVVEQTIASLRKRVDPNGVRNLQWRPVAGDRIEIQMAMPSPDAKKLRNAYLAQREAMAQDNLTRGTVTGVLGLKDDKARAAAIANIAQGNARVQSQLEKLVTLHESLVTTGKNYQEYNKLLDQARQTQAKIPPGAKDALVESQAHQKKLLADFVPITRQYNQATDTYNKAMDQLLSANVQPAELEHILNQPPMPTKGSMAEAAKTDLSYREPALAKLIKDHPDRKDQIEKTVASYNAYGKVKGPLDDPNDLITLLRGSGVLEFRIAASPKIPGIDDYRQQLRQRGPHGGDEPYRWFVVDDPRAFADTPALRQRLQADPDQFFEGRGLIGQRYAGDYYILLSNQPQDTITKSKPDWEVSSAHAATDNSGFPAVAFNLNAQGAQYMTQLTGNHRNEPMAIVLDGRVISAPNINDTIGGSGIITGGTGGFGRSELEYLVRTFNAGSLQARLGDYPISIKTIGPGLGQDNLIHGMNAAIWATVIILIFMVVYYFQWGVIANLALALNILIILAAMSLLQATFTLPGIAGIVLTLGMAVDANVLILERIREEMDRKVDLKTAVRLGYEKAFITIVDANLTTLFICIILYYTATADVKGFGLTLGLGIVASMFTALFCTHTVTDLYMRIFKPKDIPMLATVSKTVHKLLLPSVQWMNFRVLLMGMSVFLVIASLVFISFRGKQLLDIQFRSGTQVSFDTKDHTELTMKDVRGRLDKIAKSHNMPTLAGDQATVVTLGDTQTRDGQVYASSFSISTLNEDSKKVSTAVKDAFADVLVTESPFTFKGIENKDLTNAPIHPVTSASLGANINRPSITQDVTDAVGGVVVELNNLQPAATIKELTDRIQQVQMQSEFAQMGYRPFKVIGLDLAGEQHAGKEATYHSAAVVAWDNSTNYIQNPRSFSSDAQGLAATEWTLVRTAMQLDTSLGSVSNFSSAVSSTMQQQAITAMLLALLVVSVYVWFRFGSLVYGIGAIIALVHDVTIAVGFFALGDYIYTTFIGQMLLMTNFKIDLSVIAALMTIVGYSLNDTIVVYDRIRENRGRLAYASPAVINDSINQTVSRTILTAGTTLVSAMALYILGGDGVHGFAFAMLIGVTVGTYSSNFIASPILLFIKAPVRRTTAVSTTSGKHDEIGSPLV